MGCIDKESIQAAVILVGFSILIVSFGVLIFLGNIGSSDIVTVIKAIRGEE